MKQKIMPNIIEIKDFNAPELDVYARLNENQLIYFAAECLANAADALASY